MGRLRKSPRHYLHGATTEHEAEEAFRRLIEVSSEHQSVIESRVGFTERYGMLIHILSLAERLLCGLARLATDPQWPRWDSLIKAHNPHAPQITISGSTTQ